MCVVVNLLRICTAAGQHSAERISFVFHASAAVRSLIYETVLTAAVSDDDITFKELLELALFALCYARFQEETRTYKRKVKELLPYFGAGLLDVLAALK